MGKASRSVKSGPMLMGYQETITVEAYLRVLLFSGRQGSFLQGGFLP